MLARDPGADFVYAVRTTRVYCRPSCPSRRPRPDHVRVLRRAGADAERHGYRACRRCRPDDPRRPTPRVARVEAACRLLDDGDACPLLAELAARVGIVARRVAPRLPARARRARRSSTPTRSASSGCATELRDGRDVTGALYTAGYGSSSRLYEQSDARLGMTPASYGAGGAGATIAFTVVESPLGRLSSRRPSAASAGSRSAPTTTALERELRDEFPAAEIVRDDGALAPTSPKCCGASTATLPAAELPLDVRGTAFQLRVWQELQRIPPRRDPQLRRGRRRGRRAAAARAVG